MFGIVLIVSMLATSLLPASVLADSSRTYTLDADFDEGVLINVNHDAPNNDQLQLDTTAPEPLPFIWIACSARGTVVRVDVNTGQVLGEYRTAPQGRGLNPSRTTVDFEGNVWTANRNEVDFIGDVRHGSAVKIGLVIGGTRCNADGSPNPMGDYLKPPFDYSTAVDRDSDGLIKTSRGLGDIRPWTDMTDGMGSTDGAAHVARVQDADDECILIYQRLPDAEEARHVSVDANNDVWVGGYPFVQRTFHKLDQNSGAILNSFDTRPYGAGGYGGLIDGNGILWSASISQNTLLRYDIAAGTGAAIPVNSSYGLGIDTGGFIWNSMWSNDSIDKISAAGVVEPGFPKPTGGASDDRGVAVTPVDNHVWVANSGGSDVSRLDNNGNLLKVIPVGTTPTGVAVDANGKVWVTNRDSDDAMRIDPNAGGDGLGAVDMTVPLGAGAGPYNYSDMTGLVLVGSTSPQGSWTVVHEGDSDDNVWTQISWNAEPQGATPGDSSITVEARAANTQAGLSSETWVTVSNGGNPGVTGRFIEVRATLKAASDSTSPVLSDLTIRDKDDEEPGPIPGTTGLSAVVMTAGLCAIAILIVRRRQPHLSQ